MAELWRVKINWTGFPGGPGYTNLHFETTDGGAITQGAIDESVTRVQEFLGDIRGMLPLVVATGVDSMVQEIDEVTGNLETLWTGTVAAPATGSDTTVYSAVSGAVINWFTNEVRNGRRVKGRTFVVPLGGNQYDFTGTIGTSRLEDLNAAALALRTAGASRLVVWKRPTGGIVLPDGGAYPVVSHSVPDKAAMLTSRRD